MTIAIVLNNGKEIRVKCDGVRTTRSTLTGTLDNMEFHNTTENKPLYINVDHVLMVYRVLSDEEDVIGEPFK